MANDPTSWAWLKDMVSYIANPSIPMWDRASHPPPAGNPNAPGEGGVDLDSTMGTPVYALATGPVVGIGQWNDKEHQVITTRVNVPGYGVQDIYYQHIYLQPGIKEGDIVQKGQQIGQVGSFGEVEVGFNANWGGIWGTNHPGPWYSKPQPLIAALMGDNSPSVAPSGGSNNPTNPLGLDFSWITGSQFWAWLGNPMRMIKVTAGVGLVVIATILLVTPDAIKVAKLGAMFA